MLKTDKLIFTWTDEVNLLIVYELNRWLKDFNANFNLKDCSFGAVKITKTADPDKYSYLGYGIGFNSGSLFSIPNFDWHKNTTFLELVWGLSILIIKIKIS